MVGREDALLGGGDDDVVRLDGLVERGDRRAELGRARRLGVAEPLLEEPLRRVGLEREQIRDRDGFGIARGEHERGRELVPSVVLLDPEGRDPQATTLPLATSPTT